VHTIGFTPGLVHTPGLRAQDWLRTAEELTGQLQRMAAGDVAARKSFRAGYLRLRPLPEGNDGVPVETI